MYFVSRINVLITHRKINKASVTLSSNVLPNVKSESSVVMGVASAVRNQALILFSTKETSQSQSLSHRFWIVALTITMDGCNQLIESKRLHLWRQKIYLLPDTIEVPGSLVSRFDVHLGKRNPFLSSSCFPVAPIRHLNSSFNLSKSLKR